MTAAGFDCEYRGGLSNHLPMAVAALRRLGAAEERVAAFARGYAQRLEPAPPQDPWPPGDAWTQRLGDRAAWPAYRSLFADWLAHEGAGDVLQQALPTLMPGCGAAAFHGLIRTAYALHGDDAQELADALAYWACRWLPLDGRPPASDHGLIFERMQAAAAQPGFDEAVAAVALDHGTLQRLARESALLHAASGDFTVLHLVTSAHALRLLLPYVDDTLAAVDEYVAAHVAARRACGAQPGAAAEPLPWEHVVASAVASDDEHVIKLVDSCREEQRHYGGDEWQRAAARALR